MMTQEMGKPITESRGEVKYAAAFVEWYAEEAKRAYGDIVPTHAANKRLLVDAQPVGPVYAVTPWNFPAAMVTRKVAPALAAGCTRGPEAGGAVAADRDSPRGVVGEGRRPADVFQVFTTSDPRRCPTCSSRRARAQADVHRQHGSRHQALCKAAKTMKRVSLELGGHAPFIICDDADIPAAVSR
jgi:succinate-semialdehyde dehydrogenase/glutarate-semialdehyde dehydrogenase